MAKSVFPINKEAFCVIVGKITLFELTLQNIICYNNKILRNQNRPQCKFQIYLISYIELQVSLTTTTTVFGQCDITKNKVVF